MTNRFLIIIFTLLLSHISVAQDLIKNPMASQPTVEKGWFWFEDPKEKEPPKESEETPPPILSLPTTPPPAPKEDKCKSKETWSADCGFVDPGSDFSFQAKQRDALFEQMSVSKNNPKAVEAAQYYMRWVLERTSEVSNLWWYNMIQNPNLDPTVAKPISAFGIRLMADVKKGTDAEVFSLLQSEKAFFVYFSRSDCEFCHAMQSPVKSLSKKVGIPVYNASLDASCISGFEGEFCRPNSIAPAQALKVETVPSVFLFIPKNTWIRIATGLTDVDTMITRSSQFFSAYRNALLKSVENGENGKPSVDFSTSDAKGNSTGIKIPTQEEVNKLLGK